MDGVGGGIDEFAHAAGDARADEHAFVTQMALARDTEVADSTSRARLYGIEDVSELGRPVDQRPHNLVAWCVAGPRGELG